MVLSEEDCSAQSEKSQWWLQGWNYKPFPILMPYGHIVAIREKKIKYCCHRTKVMIQAQAKRGKTRKSTKTSHIAQKRSLLKSTTNLPRLRKTWTRPLRLPVSTHPMASWFFWLWQIVKELIEMKNHRTIR